MPNPKTTNENKSPRPEKSEKLIQHVHLSGPQPGTLIYLFSETKVF